jgi:hypothetical protein
MTRQWPCRLEFLHYLSRQEQILETEYAVEFWIGARAFLQERFFFVFPCTGSAKEHIFSKHYKAD